MPLINLQKLLKELENNEIVTLDLSSLEIGNYEAKSTLQTWHGHSNTIRALTLLPDGVLASGANDTTIRLWDIYTGQCLREIKEWRVIFSLATLPDGTLASGSDVYSNTVDIWNVADGKCLKTLKGHTCTIYSLATLPDGNLASGAEDNKIKIWDIKNGVCLKTLSHGKGRDVDGIFYALLALPNKQLLSGSRCGIKLWNIDTGECIKLFKGHTSDVIALTLLSDNRLASGSHDGDIKIWDLETGECLKTFHHNRCVFSLSVLPNGNLVGGYQDRSIRVWNVKTGQCINTLIGHSNPVSALLMLPDGRLVSASEDSTIKIWSFPKRQLKFSDCELLLEKFNVNSSVKHLILKGITLTQEDILFLSKKISAHKILIELDLRQCQITPEGQQTLAKTFEDHSSIEKLHLDIGTFNFKRQPFLLPLNKNNNIDSSNHANLAKPAEKDAENKVQQLNIILANTPKEYFCPLTQQIFYSPVSLTVGSESYIYEQEAIETWLKEHNTNPLTGEELVDKKTFSVTILRNLISSYLAQNPLLWESEEIYFSLKLAEQFANAIVENDIVSVRRYLALDPRLISNPLKLEKTALMLACEYSTLEILSLILQGIKDKLKIPIEYKTDTSLSLLYSVSSNLKLPGVRLLNEALMWREADYQQFFMQAVKDRRLDVVDNILSLGVNPNMLLANGTTLLEYAVNEQLVSLIEVLVKHNVALTVQDYKGNNLLHQAIIKHHNLLALWFIENVKLSLNSQNKQGQSALHLAIENSQNDIIQALLKHGNIDINQADAQDNTVLHLAVAKGDQALALLLVEKDVSIKCKNKNQETAIDLASKLGYHQLAVNLKQYHQRHKIAFLLKPLEDKIADQEKQLLLQQQELLRLQVKELEITTLQKELASLKDENQNFKKHINFWLQDKAKQDPAVLADEIPAKHQAPIKLMAKVADDMIITVAKDNHIILWELKNNILKAKVDFSQYKEYLTYSEIVAIQPISQDNILLVYNTAVFETLNLKTKLFTYKRPQSGAADNFSTVYSFVMLPENRALIGSSRYEMLLIDLTTLKVLDVITTKNWVPDTLLLLSNGRLASGAKEKVVKIWDIQMGTNIATFIDNIPIALRKEITSLCELPNNLLATGHTDNLVKIWNLKTGKCLKTFNEIASTNVNFFNNNNKGFNFNFAVTKITCLQLTADGKILICGSSNGSIMGWELATENRLQCLSGHSASVNSIIALSNHEFITCSDDQKIKVWKVANNNIELNHAEEVQTLDRANECKIS